MLTSHPTGPAFTERPPGPPIPTPRQHTDNLAAALDALSRFRSDLVTLHGLLGTCVADIAGSSRALAVQASPLTERETEVLELVAEGLTNTQIAVALHVRSTTVNSHLMSVLVKSSSENRAGAVARALRAGWIR